MQARQTTELEDLIDDLYSARANYLKRIDDLKACQEPQDEIDGYINLISNINDTLMTLATQSREQRRH